jgi:hypothetical protein
MMSSKLESLSTSGFPGGIPRPAAGEEVAALMLVKRPHYVPPGVVLRARISDVLFTCSFDADKLPELEGDDLIQTISLPQPLRPAERPNKAHSRWQLLRQSLDYLASVVERERTSLSVSDEEVIAAWLRGEEAETVAAVTGRSLQAVRGVTFRFRFRPAIWEAIHQARQAIETDDFSPLVGVADLRNLEVLLLDMRERP